MDESTPGADGATESGAPERTIEMIPRFILDHTVVDASLYAIEKVTSGLLTAFDLLNEDGNGLNDLQKTEIMKSVIFNIRDIDRELKNDSDFGIAMHHAYNGQTVIPVPNSVVQEFKDMFEFDPTDPDGDLS